MSKKHYADRNLKFETLQLHVGQETPDPVTDARAVPIYLTSSYVFHNSEHAADRFGLRDAGNIYGRLTNPTEDVFERRIAALEGGVAALAVGSGAAALTYAFQAVAHAGDHIVAAKNIYGGTYNLLAHTLPDYGIEATFVDPFDYDGIKAAIKENTKAIEIETLGNPNSEVVDNEKIANISHEAGITLIFFFTFIDSFGDVVTLTSLVVITIVCAQWISLVLSFFLHHVKLLEDNSIEFRSGSLLQFQLSCRSFC